MANVEVRTCPKRGVLMTSVKLDVGSTGDWNSSALVLYSDQIG
jgi:hypothetical protein